MPGDTEPTRMEGEVWSVSDVFGRNLGDDRLEAEISTALAERVHRRARLGLWSSRIALAAASVLAVVALAVLVLEVGRGAGPVLGLSMTAVAAVVAAAAAVVARTTGARTKRLLASSAPEGGVVLGLSSAGVHLAHLPLLEWSAVTALCVSDTTASRHRNVVVGVAVHDVGAARARVIDARLTHLVRPFPRRGPLLRRITDSDTPGFLTVELSDLLDAATIATAVRRLETETTRRGIPFRRVDDSRRLVAVLREHSATVAPDPDPNLNPDGRRGRRARRHDRHGGRASV